MQQLLLLKEAYCSFFGVGGATCRAGGRSVMWMVNEAVVERRARMILTDFFVLPAREYNYVVVAVVCLFKKED